MKTVILTKTRDYDVLKQSPYSNILITPDEAEQFRLGRSTHKEEEMFQFLKCKYEDNVDKRMKFSYWKTCESCGTNLLFRAFDSVEWLIEFYIYGLCRYCIAFGCSRPQTFTYS